MKRATLILGILGIAAGAWAGAKGAQPVTIDQAGQTANGSLGSARNSPDTIQWIGCMQSADSRYVLYRSALVCWAMDEKGNFASCWTYDPAYMEVSRSINGDSSITFAWDKNNYCTSLMVYNTSVQEPK